MIIDKTIFYYDDYMLPRSMRIRSEALCLDHTFLPELSSFSISSFTYDVMVSLLKNPAFDITAEFTSGTLYLVTGGKEVTAYEGFVHFDDSIEIRHIREMPADTKIIG